METWILWIDKLDGDVYHTLAGLLGAIEVALEHGAEELVMKKQERT